MTDKDRIIERAEVMYHNFIKWAASYYENKNRKEYLDIMHDARLIGNILGKNFTEVEIEVKEKAKEN